MRDRFSSFGAAASAIAGGQDFGIVGPFPFREVAAATEIDGAFEKLMQADREVSIYSKEEARLTEPKEMATMLSRKLRGEGILKPAEAENVSAYLDNLFQELATSFKFCAKSVRIKTIRPFTENGIPCIDSSFKFHIDSPSPIIIVHTFHGTGTEIADVSEETRHGFLRLYGQWQEGYRNYTYAKRQELIELSRLMDELAQSDNIVSLNKGETAILRGNLGGPEMSTIHRAPWPLLSRLVMSISEVSLLHPTAA